MGKMFGESKGRREREGDGNAKWEREKRKFFEERGYIAGEINGREGETNWESLLREADKERQRRERWEKIKKFSYNRWYS